MGLKTHLDFPPFLQYLHNSHINLYVLHASKHFNLVTSSIAFLNGDSFKGASTNRQSFWQAVCIGIAFFLKRLLGLSFNGFKVYDL
jgi:hypothetical protein